MIFRAGGPFADSTGAATAGSGRGIGLAMGVLTGFR